MVRLEEADFRNNKIYEKGVNLQLHRIFVPLSKSIKIKITKKGEKLQ